MPPESLSLRLACVDYDGAEMIDVDHCLRVDPSENGSMWNRHSMPKMVAACDALEDFCRG